VENPYRPERIIFEEDYLYLAYHNKETNRMMHVEIYDDGDFGYIIEDLNKRKSLENENVSYQNLKLRIEKFVEENK